MIIMASHDLESPLQLFDATILEDVMSIFITSAGLKLIQGQVILFSLCNFLKVNAMVLGLRMLFQDDESSLLSKSLHIS